MKTPSYTKQFKKDIKRIQKSGKKTEKLKKLLYILTEEEYPLSPLYRDHSLEGEFKGCRECHIEGDWLLIYEIIGDDIYFIRTGSHSELFE